MLQRLKAFSGLSGALLVMGALVSACSIWGGNPPPRYNTVIGEKRIPPLNPGGNKIVRPADSIEPAPPAQIVRPQSQRVIPQSYESAMNESNVIKVAPSAESVASEAAAPVAAPAITAVQEKPIDALPAQLTPAQLAAAAPAAGGNVAVTPMAASVDAKVEVAQAKQDMAALASERTQMSAVAAPASAPSAEGNHAADLEEQAVKLFSTAKLDVPKVGGESAPAAVSSAPASSEGAGWHTVDVTTAGKVEAVERLAIPNNAAPAPMALGGGAAEERKPLEENVPQVKMSEAKMAQPQVQPVPVAPAEARVAEVAPIAPPVFTRKADGSWDQKADVAAVAEPAQTVYEAPVNASSSVVTNVVDAPAVSYDQATDAASTSSVVASAGASHVQGDYLPPSRYSRYRGGYQNYRLDRLSGAVSSN